MSFIVDLLASWGLSQRVARLLAPLAAALAALALLAALWGAFQAWDWWDDRQAVEDDRNAANAEFRERQVKAERKAGGDKAARDAAEAERQRDLQEELDDANQAGGTGADTVWGGLFD